MSVGPVDTSLVVIVERDGGRHEGVFEVEIGQDVGDMEERLDAFICTVDFGFNRAASRDGLSFRFPMEGTSEPNDETRHGAGFEEVEKGGWGARFRDAGILGALVTISEGTSGGGKGEVDVSRCGGRRLG